MTSRKAQKRSSSTSRQANFRKDLRRGRAGQFETLEERRLMTVQPWTDGKYYPPGAEQRIELMSGMTVDQYKTISRLQYGDYYSNAMQPEGAGGSQTINETEPNSAIRNAQVLPLGNLSSQVPAVDVLGALTRSGGAFDEDYFALDLQAGDIVDARITAVNGTFQISILDSNGTEIAGNQNPIFGGLLPTTYPSNSPLFFQNLQTPDPTHRTTLSLTIPKSGRYYARVMDGDTNYTLSLRTYRTTLESEPINTKQKVFLDFDGATVRRDIFGAAIPGTARLSPLSTFLPGWGLQASDENMVIDKIIAAFRQRFITDLPVTGNNGYLGSSGIPGQFDLEIFNSRDHGEMWGLPNVTRIIVSGSSIELGIGGATAIAESIDVGNFKREETAVILLDTILPQYQFIPRSAAVPLVDALTTAIGVVSAHEMGHLLGMRHTLNTNSTIQLNDTGGVVTGRLGVGTDGIFGTADDQPIKFGVDTYDAATSNVAFGIQDTPALLASALATGTAGGGFISGVLYEDLNSNRVYNVGDNLIPNFRIYADINGDGVYQVGEPQTLTRANGTYTLTVLPGSYTVRVDLAPAPIYKVTTPVSTVFSASVSASQAINNVNFAIQAIDQSITGFKYNDANGNGAYEVGEAFIAGSWIFLDLDGDARIDLGEPAVQTDANGRYTLRFPGPGTYIVRELIEPGFVETLPGPTLNNRYVVVVTGNPAIDATRISGLNFATRVFLDLGDAPNTYGTLRASGGAAHGFVTGLFLGTNWDAEQDGQPTATALGDDNNGLTDSTGVVADDEDGVELARPISRTATNVLAVDATNTTATTAYLHAWVDLNGDGDFLDSGEKVLNNYVIAAGATGVQAVTFPALSGARLGDTYMRVRMSYDQNLAATGLSASGEVEDYLITVVDTPQVAVNDTFSVSRNSTLNSLDVTANDFKITGETLSILSAGPSRAGAIIQRTTDGKILYTPPSGFVGTDTFPYTIQNSTGETSTATVSVTVNLFFENPMAIDDSFDVPTNATSFPLNVLANDIEGRAGALSIISVTQGSLGGQISIATGGQSLRYTPVRNLGDTETFSYTVSDSSGKTSTAKVTLHTQPGDQTNDTVLIRLVATDLNGAAITAIPQGQDFKIDVFVDDLRSSSGDPVLPSAAGVSSAYLDLLYNLQLVSTVASAAGSRFDFDVTFFNNFNTLQLGDASVPGIVDDFGAFNSSSTINAPDPVRMASLRFTARSPGIATFTADPADDPVANVLLFDSPGTTVPLERIRYVGTTLEIVGDSAEFPQAVDDSFASNIPTGAVAFPLNVLSNDRAGSTGVIRLSTVSQPSNGSATISTNGTPNDPTDDRILYTPNANFTGTDTFTYVITDSRLVQSTAKVTVRVGSTAVTDANDDVSLRLQLYKTDGTPLADGETLPVGSKFQLRGFVKDLRSPFTGGVFAAFEDILYSSSIVSVDADSTNPQGFAIVFGNDYKRVPPVQSGDIRTPGLINEVGAVQTGDAPLGPDEKLLFTITLTAKAVGTANFVGDPADILPLHDTLLFQPPTAVIADRIRYGFDSVNIVAATGAAGEGNTNLVNQYDVNNDGRVTPIDVLNVINALNQAGGMSAVGEGEGDGKLYLDVNADGILSPMDALLVINHLNANGAGEGEGQAAPLVVLSNRLAASITESAAEGELNSESTVALLASGSSEVYGPVNSTLDWAPASTSDSALSDILDELAPEIDGYFKRK